MGYLNEQPFSDYVKYWKNKLNKNANQLEKRKQTLREVALKCATILKNEFYIIDVFLIGSLTGDRVIDEISDIDIAVSGLQDEKYFPALARLYKELPKGCNLDLITIESSDKSMIKKIQEEGERL